MCVKEFFGYNCGHCSIPRIKKCPLALSNPIFPICRYPAERPIFTGDYCHPCFRVVWNFKVLQEEEEHRGRHLSGECLCEIIFDTEERETRLRERLTNEIGEGTSRDQDQHSVQHDIAEGATPQVSTSGEDEPQGHLYQNDCVGRYLEHGDVQITNRNQSYAITLGAHEFQEQLMIGEGASGMRWYPYATSSAQPSRPRHKTNRTQKAASVTTALTPNPGPSELTAGDAEPQQPMVVSSDMGRLDYP
jgi:hypothetical protein